MKKNLGTNLERTFGIEIEIVGLAQHEAEEVLIRNEIPTQANRWTPHHTRRYPEGVWKVVPDGSLQGSKSCEVVSPPMSIANGGLDRLEKVLTLLKEAGADVNASCGIHVHHDINDYDNVKHFQQLLALYVRYEGTIDSFLPKSRRDNNNRFCRSMRGMGYDNNERIKSVLRSIRECKTPEEIVRVYGTRYVKVNLQSYVTYGTVEFRQHAGSLDFEKIKNWVIFTQAIVERALHGRVQLDVDPETLDDSYMSLRKAIRGYKWMGADEYLVDAMTYFNNRAKTFEREERVG